MTHKSSWFFIENFTESNQFEVRQNAGDDNSPLTCDPECPQEEYVYDYQYAGSANSQGKFIWIPYKKLFDTNCNYLYFLEDVYLTLW